MNNSIFEEDIKNIINYFDMSVFDGKTILVTGATGLSLLFEMKKKPKTFFGNPKD